MIIPKPEPEFSKEDYKRGFKDGYYEAIEQLKKSGHKAHWEAYKVDKSHYYYYCDNCGNQSKYKKTPFCPLCGSQMEI